MRRDPIGAVAGVFPVSRRALAPLVDEIAGVKNKPRAPLHQPDADFASNRSNGADGRSYRHP
jgi:hypothetical protein